MRRKITFQSKLLTQQRLKTFGSLNLSEFAKIDYTKKIKLQNYVHGKFSDVSKYEFFPHPLNGSEYLQVPLTQGNELTTFHEFINSCPKHGLHNPLKNVDRYVSYGHICRKISESLHNPEIFNHFVELIKAVFPKFHGQAVAEMSVTRAFIDNFAGDNV
jgi:1-pyrroline-5-carboxylate dehydrogenase